MKRPGAGTLFRLVFALALLGYTLWRSNPREVWQVCTHAALVPLLVAVSLVLIDRAVMAYRWFVLLRPLEGKNLPPFWTILRIFFVSTFVGTFLPASIGGDAVRAYSLSNHRVPIADSMASVVVDRMLGVLSVLDRDARRPGSDADMRLLSLFADQAALALESVRQFSPSGLAHLRPDPDSPSPCPF